MRLVRAERQQAVAQIHRSLKAWRSEAARQEAGRRPPIPQHGGAALPAPARATMEQQLDADLSGVKIHTSGESARAADGLNARAFTVGQDVHFGSGQFSPGTKEGDKLLAHELTHVVQGQRSGVQRKAEDAAPGAAEHGGNEEGGEVSQPGEPAEQEADAVAEKVATDLHGGEAAKADRLGKSQAPAIGAKLNGVGRKIFRQTAKEQAEGLEQRDGGHSLGRHGPDVTDQQLKDRITTGVAPDNKFSPTDVSTKFASYEVYLETRAKAAATLDAAVTTAKAKFAPLLAELQKAEGVHKTAPPGPDKGPKGKFGMAVADAKRAITDACATAAGQLPAKAAVNDPTVRVKLATSYAVVVEHGKSIGSGFQGAGGEKQVADPADATKTGKGHNATAPLAAATRSRTTFDTGAPALMAAPLAETMKVAQHFPTIDPAGIS
jgi:hypothetical protein